MTQQHDIEAQAILRQLQQKIFILGVFLVIFFGLELADQLFFQRFWNGGLDIFGIIPRRFIGLRGVLFAPFLHGDLGHLLANSIPFAFLGWLVMLEFIRDFFIVSGFSMVVGGVGTWLVGAPNSVHIGASILIFGYLGFLIFKGYFRRDIPSITISLLVLFFYGGALWSVLPTTTGMSWEGHLFGLIGGAIAANFLYVPKANR